ALAPQCGTERSAFADGYPIRGPADRVAVAGAKARMGCSHGAGLAGRSDRIKQPGIPEIWSKRQGGRGDAVSGGRRGGSSDGVGSGQSRHRSGVPGTLRGGRRGSRRGGGPQSAEQLLHGGCTVGGKGEIRCVSVLDILPKW